MVHVNLLVPEELKEMMDKHPEMNWSEIARQAFKDKISQLELLDSIASKSKLSEKDALDLSRKIKKSMWERRYKRYS